MKTQLFRFALCSLIVYLTGFTLNPVVAASQPSGGDGTHFCGVVDFQPDKRDSDQFPNRHYAQTFAANLNVGEPYTVRLIYFLANDRPVEQDIDAKLDRLIKRIQHFYEDEMERHEFGRKTFRVETDATGKAVVHHVNGQFTAEYYRDGNLHKPLDEIRERFDMSKNIYLVVIDVGEEKGGQGSGESHSGVAIMTTNSDCRDTETSFNLATHELGHAFGLPHDFRNESYIMGYGSRVIVQLSKCAAEWLDVHRYFNTNQTPVDTPTTIQMLPPLAYPPNAIRLRFTITDADDLHQAQLHGPTGPPYFDVGLIACKRLNGESITVEFVTTADFTAGPYNNALVSVIDVNGNFTHQRYPIREEDVRVDVSSRVDINGDGVIDVDDRVPATLRIVSGDNQRGFPNSWLTEPLVVEVLDADGAPVVGIEVVFRVIGGAALSVPNPRTDANGWAQSSLILDNHYYPSQVEVSIAGASERVTFNVGSAPQVLVAQSERPPMYWIIEGDDAGGGRVDGLIGDEVEIFGKYATSVALDVSPGGKLYWTAARVDGKLACGAVLRGSREIPTNKGSQPEEITVFDARPLAIAVDTTESKLYWTDSRGNIMRADINGSNIQNLITGLDSPKDISIDVADGKLYWTETQNNIRRANLNGSNIETLATDLGTLGSITVVGGNLYWTEKIGEEHGKISRANLDGLNVEDIAMLSSVPVGIAVDIANSKLYWTDTRGRIRRANLNGLNIEEIVKGLFAPGDLVLGILRLVQISGNNQQGKPGKGLTNPLVVEVRDQYDNPLPNVHVTFTPTAGGGTLSTTSAMTDENGRAESTLTLGPNLGTNTVEVSAAGIQGLATFHAISDTESPPIAADINNDGSVNILDLILIAFDLGNVGANIAADVNGDGVVSILDLVLVAGMFDGAAAAPSAQPQVPETLTAVEVQGWLIDARALQVRDPIMKRGFLVLEQLLVVLTPKETELLSNYPNPFNPETWIPYRLAEEAFVTLTIYDLNGQVVRTLDVGHRIAAVYENRSKAIYWDGRNEVGEQVASGVYFYNLSTGNYSATRKMLVVK